MDDFELELKQDFLVESEDLLISAEEAFLRLEEERTNPDLLNEIFRLAHNLKGTSKAVGFDQLAELTHVAENVILKLKEGILEITDDAVSLLLEFKDKVVEMIEGLKEDVNASFEIASLQEKLSDFIENGGLASHTEEVALEETEEVISPEKIPDADSFEENDENLTAEIDPAALESLKELGQDISGLGLEAEIEEEEIELSAAALESLEELGHSIDSSCEEEIKKVEAVRPEAEEKEKKEIAKNPVKGDTEESIRVKLPRIDKINNVIGELVILQTVVSQRRYEFIQDDLSNKSIGMMGKLFKEVQELAMSLRMLPLKSTFQKMNRIVRDTSKALDKSVKLHIVGDETEVDKTVLEKLADPLVHIVRNAVDHGLEETKARAIADKTETGNVELMAFHEGSNLVIQVTDDGKGIDPKVIRQKAIEKKVIPASSNLPDEDIIQLIFHPGFSTKEQVTEVSGRGVGMDVVKTNIEGLGGSVKVMSRLKIGTSFKIVLPLTLAIIEGIIISCQGKKYIIPLSQIFEIVQVKSEQIESFSNLAKLFKLRGEVLPLFFLNKNLGEKTKEGPYYTAIIISGLSHTFGVVVDDIINQQQIVIKKLGDDVQNKKGIMGSAIMADGRPSLILDLFEIFKEDLTSSRGYQKLMNNKNNSNAA